MVCWQRNGFLHHHQQKARQHSLDLSTGRFKQSLIGRTPRNHKTLSKKKRGAKRRVRTLQNMPCGRWFRPWTNRRDVGVVKVGLRAHRAVWKKDDILSALFLLLFKDGDILDVYYILYTYVYHAWLQKKQVKISHVELRWLWTCRGMTPWLPRSAPASQQETSASPRSWTAV